MVEIALEALCSARVIPTTPARILSEHTNEAAREGGIAVLLSDPPEAKDEQGLKEVLLFVKVCSLKFAYLQKFTLQFVA